MDDVVFQQPHLHTEKAGTTSSLFVFPKLRVFTSAVVFLKTYFLDNFSNPLEGLNGQ